MGINKGVNEAHHHDPILEASQVHLGDQVMEKMASPWKHRSVSQQRGKHIVQERTRVVMRDRESRAHPGIQLARLFLSFSVKSLCRTQPIVKDVNFIVNPGREARDASFMWCRVSAIR